MIGAFGAVTLGAVGAGLYFLIDQIAGDRAQAVVEERLTNERIIEIQTQALDAIVEARSETGLAEERAADLRVRAETLLEDIRKLNAELVEREVELNVLQPLFDTGAEILDVARSAAFKNEVAGGIDPAPSGMVAAFTGQADVDDVANHCPEGWSNFDEARGRFIVGAGPQSVLSEDLTPFSEGGEERVTLKESEMPRHNHGGALMIKDGTLYGMLNDNRFHNSGAGITLHASGSSQPHNNMPPYIALYFCKKD